MKFEIPHDLTPKEFFSGVSSILRNQNYSSYIIDVKLKAKLINRDRFTKIIDISDLNPHLVYPKRVKFAGGSITALEYNYIEQMDFYMIDRQYITDDKGTHCLVAVYEES